MDFLKGKSGHSLFKKIKIKNGGCEEATYRAHRKRKAGLDYVTLKLYSLKLPYVAPALLRG